MADTSLAAAREELLTAMLTYSDWASIADVTAVGEYSMEDAAGPTVTDSAASPANGTAGASVVFQQPGRVGYSIDLDDADGTGQVSIGNAAKYNLTESTGLTLAMWVKPDGAAEEGWPVSRTDFGNFTGYGIRWDGGSDTVEFWYGTGFAFVIKTSNAVFTDDDTWVHVAVVLETDGSGTFYRNGSPAGTFSGVAITSAADDVMILGNYDGGADSGTRFDGGMDELRIYDSALDSAAIDQLNVPHVITIGEKMKGDPFAPGNTAKTLPLLVAQATNTQPGALHGTQQEITFTVRLSLLRQAAAGEEPAAEIDELTGYIIENILQTKYVLASLNWLDLTWITRIPLVSKHPPDNNLQRWLNGPGADQDGTGLPYSASQTDFTVQAFYVPGA